MLDYWWIFWVRIEVSSWALIPYLFKNASNLLEFVFWQRIGSLIFSVLFIMLKFKWCVVLLLFKIALPPFHVWFLGLVKSVGLFFFLLFTYLNKVPYLYVLGCVRTSLFLSLVLIFPLIVLVYFWICINLKFLLWVTRLADFPWGYLSTKSNHLLTFYIRLTIGLMLALILTRLKLGIFLLCFFILGLPPFRLFHVKLIILSSSFQIKVFFFIIFSISNRLFVWFLLFITWFQIRIIPSVALKSVIFLFILINFFWLIF